MDLIKVSEYRKKAVVELLDRGASVELIAKEFNVREQTIMDWVDSWSREINYRSTHVFDQEGRIVRTIVRR